MMPPEPTARAGDLQSPPVGNSSSSTSKPTSASDGDCKSPAPGGSPAFSHQPPPSDFFNQDAPVRRYRNWLPHWRQPGKWYFVTFRLADSLAQVKLEEWAEERETWFQFHPQPWSEKVEQEYHRRFTAHFERWLDAGEGECVLRQPEAHAAVASALKFFAAEPRAGDLQSPPEPASSSSADGVLNPTDGDYKSPAQAARAGGLQPPTKPFSSSSASEVLRPTGGDCKSPARDIRYELGDFVVMPNHVHLLVRPLGEWRLEELLKSWKTFSAKSINRLRGRTGTVWWKDSFNHLVRSAEKFAKFQHYIADNPAKAKLKPGEYHLHRTSLCYLNTPP